MTHLKWDDISSTGLFYKKWEGYTRPRKLPRKTVKQLCNAAKAFAASPSGRKRCGVTLAQISFDEVDEDT